MSFTFYAFVQFPVLNTYILGSILHSELILQ